MSKPEFDKIFKASALNYLYSPCMVINMSNFVQSNWYIAVGAIIAFSFFYIHSYRRMESVRDNT